MSEIQELIGKAVVKKTKSQGASLLQHRKHHTMGHMLLMMRLMIEEHIAFKDAHERAMKQVGR